MTIIVDYAEQHAPKEPEECKLEGCPGEEGWEPGYGLAGGGMGFYLYCAKCERVVSKTQDHFDE